MNVSSIYSLKLIWMVTEISLSDPKTAIPFCNFIPHHVSLLHFQSKENIQCSDSISLVIPAIYRFFLVKIYGFCGTISAIGISLCYVFYCGNYWRVVPKHTQRKDTNSPLLHSRCDANRYLLFCSI